MDEITILDKTYISSKRAAEITGYAKDYVGQLCREGHVDAKMVGRSWYVFEPSIRKHRFGLEETEKAQESTEDVVVEESEAPKASSWEPSVYKSESVDMIPDLRAAPEPLHTVHSAPIAPINLDSSYEDPSATLTDMQSAWREWFDRKQELNIESPQVIDARNDAENEVAEQPEMAIEAPETLVELPEAPELLLPTSNVEQNYQETVEETDFSIPIHKIRNAAEDATHEAEAHSTAYTEPEEDFSVPIQRIRPAGMPVPHTEAPEGVIRKERIIKRNSKRARKSAEKKRSNVVIAALLIAVSMVALATAALGTGYAENYLGGRVVHNPIVNFLVGDSTFERQ